MGCALRGRPAAQRGPRLLQELRALAGTQPGCLAAASRSPHGGAPWAARRRGSPPCRAAHWWPPQCPQTPPTPAGAHSMRGRGERGGTRGVRRMNSRRRRRGQRGVVPHLAAQLVGAHGHHVDDFSKLPEQGIQQLPQLCRQRRDRRWGAVARRRRPDGGRSMGRASRPARRRPQGAPCFLILSGRFCT